jgi:hypothetical protein
MVFGLTGLCTLLRMLMLPHPLALMPVAVAFDVAFAFGDQTLDRSDTDTVMLFAVYILVLVLVHASKPALSTSSSSSPSLLSPVKIRRFGLLGLVVISASPSLCWHVS